MKEKIIECLKQNKFLSISDLTHLLNESETDLYKSLTELENENIIHKSKKDKYGLLENFHWYIGTINLKPKGYGFFKCDKLEDDVYISSLDLDNALDGDTVIAWVDLSISDIEGKREGKVIKVLSHNKKLVCEVMANHTLKSLLYPSLKIISEDVTNYKYGDLLYCEVLDADLIRKMTLKLHIVSFIGNIQDKGIEILKLCFAAVLPNILRGSSGLYGSLIFTGSRGVVKIVTGKSEIPKIFPIVILLFYDSSDTPKYSSTFLTIWSSSKGLVMYSFTPVSSPIALSSSCERAVTIMIGISLYLLSYFNRRLILYPLIFGIITSRIIKSGMISLASLKPSSPLNAV